MYFGIHRPLGQARVFTSLQGIFNFFFVQFVISPRQDHCDHVYLFLPQLSYFIVLITILKSSRQSVCPGSDLGR